VGDGDTETVDHTKILEAGSVHDQEGEGEEDEDTTHSVKTKVYSLNKEEGVWKELGLGLLKVKKHEESGAGRLLLRNSSTGKIMIVSPFHRLHSHMHMEGSHLFVELPDSRGDETLCHETNCFLDGP
jgi:hypothetical protein